MRSVGTISKSAFRWVTGILIPVIVTACLIASCTCRTSGDKNQAQVSTDHKEDLIKRQQHIIKDESEDIESYISRKNYTMTATQTGLRYTIYHKGTGSVPVVDDSVVEINYRVSLLDGTEIYNSESVGKMQVKVGKSEVASGLHEGLKLMREGDKAVFILPSHLAYGLTGDGDKIKQYQVLVINVEMLAVLNNQ